MEQDQALARKVVSGKRCVVCSVGEIIQIVTMQYNPASGPLILGPGSTRQYVPTPSDFHCEKCGIKYQFVPATAKDV